MVIVTVSTFSFPTTILFGAGAVGRLPEELSKRGISRPLLVTDAGLARTPVFARVASLAPGAVVFSAVEPNPTERNVLDGLALYQQNRCNGIVGLGGGSPLDAAKAIRLKVTHELPLAEYDDLLDGARSHLGERAALHRHRHHRGHRQRSVALHRDHHHRHQPQDRGLQPAPDSRRWPSPIRS